MKKLLYILVLYALAISCSTAKQFAWNDELSAKSEAIGLTKDEVIVLASLVEKESSIPEEQKKIAQVFLNRLEKGMKLQSDPSVLFAASDTVAKRVTRKHLQTDSPYNTYKYHGLPPGPICTPSKQAILSVLNAEENYYLFFVSKPNMKGYYNYAATYREHLNNARLYAEWIKQKQ